MGDPVGKTVRRGEPRDHPAVLRLLRGAGLPTEDVPGALDRLIVSEHGDELIGAVGLERTADPAALLRSLVVAPSYRGAGVGRALVAAIVAEARDARISRLYLVTIDEERWFASLGFETIERSAAPAAILRTRELSALCPGSAPLMVMSLDRADR